MQGSLNLQTDRMQARMMLFFQAGRGTERERERDRKRGEGRMCLAIKRPLGRAPLLKSGKFAVKVNISKASLQGFLDSSSWKKARKI